MPEYIHNPTSSQIKRGMCIRMKKGDGLLVENVFGNIVQVRCSIRGAKEYVRRARVSSVEVVWWARSSYEETIDLINAFNSTFVLTVTSEHVH